MKMNEANHLNLTLKMLIEVRLEAYLIAENNPVLGNRVDAFVSGAVTCLSDRLDDLRSKKSSRQDAFQLTNFKRKRPRS
jgi:hypothetical protein